MSFNAYQGICAGGPWDKKVKTFQSRRVHVANNGGTWVTNGVMPDAEGSYYYREPNGPDPGRWMWLAARKDND